MATKERPVSKGGEGVFGGVFKGVSRGCLGGVEGVSNLKGIYDSDRPRGITHSLPPSLPTHLGTFCWTLSRDQRAASVALALVPLSAQRWRPRKDPRKMARRLIVVRRCKDIKVR